MNANSNAPRCLGEKDFPIAGQARKPRLTAPLLNPPRQPRRIKIALFSCQADHVEHLPGNAVRRGRPKVRLPLLPVRHHRRHPHDPLDDLEERQTHRGRTVLAVHLLRAGKFQSPLGPEGGNYGYGYGDGGGGAALGVVVDTFVNFKLPSGFCLAYFLTKRYSRFPVHTGVVVLHFCLLSLRVDLGFCIWRLQPIDLRQPRHLAEHHVSGMASDFHFLHGHHQRHQRDNLLDAVLRVSAFTIPSTTFDSQPLLSDAVIQFAGLQFFGSLLV